MEGQDTTQTESADAPVVAESQEVPAAPTSGVYWGVGRRKAAVARVRVLPGDGKIIINRKPLDEFFRLDQDRSMVRAPLLATKTDRGLDVFVNVKGGGLTGQSGAIRMGLARALVEADKRFESVLRERQYLTRDARVVERKKYGKRKARRSFQFSKR